MWCRHREAWRQKPTGACTTENGCKGLGLGVASGWPASMAYSAHKHRNGWGLPTLIHSYLRMATPPATNRAQRHMRSTAIAKTATPLISGCQGARPHPHPHPHPHTRKPRHPELRPFSTHTSRPFNLCQCGLSPPPLFATPPCGLSTVVSSFRLSTSAYLPRRAISHI